MGRDVLLIQDVMESKWTLGRRFLKGEKSTFSGFMSTPFSPEFSNSMKGDGIVGWTSYCPEDLRRLLSGSNCRTVDPLPFLVS